MQIFTRNQRQWKAKPIAADERERFRSAFKDSEVEVAFSHASYLVNLASANTVLREKSMAAFQAEVERCTELGLAYTVLHPGAAGEQALEEAVENVAHSLKKIIDATPGSGVMVLLENTAGQGTSIGGKLENLRMIADAVGHERIGFCFDTCHAFAAGYDIRTMPQFEKVVAHVDATLGLENVKVFHLNDSKGKLGSHLDRHGHIGKGEIGIPAFEGIMNRFPQTPKVLETPKKDEMDLVNLRTLRELMR